MKVIVRKVLLGLETRDGEIMIAEADDGTCYLVAEANTSHNVETLQGFGSTEEIEISRDAFDALANAGPTDRRDRRVRWEQSYKLLWEFKISVWDKNQR